MYQCVFMPKEFWAGVGHQLLSHGFQSVPFRRLSKNPFFWGSKIKKADAEKLLVLGVDSKARSEGTKVEVGCVYSLYCLTFYLP